MAAVASPTAPKTTIVQIQRVRTLEEDSCWYSFPESALSTSSHPKLMEMPAMKTAVKSLSARGQSRNVTVGLSGDTLKIYNDVDGNFIFGDYMLPETRFQPSSEASDISELVQTLSSITNREESVKSILKHFLIEKFSSKSKNCLLYTSPSPRDRTRYRMPSSA